MKKSHPIVLFLSRLLRQRRLLNPDGRPLWRYRFSSTEVEEARRLLRLSLAEKEIATSWFAQLFVMFAAELWRREYRGHDWSWRVILEPLDFGGSYTDLYEPIELGLSRWRRPLLRGSSGRLFLATLVAEGGFPIRMIEKDGALLRRYFRRMLAEFRHLQSSQISARDLATELGHDMLPPSSHREGLFSLAGDLVEGISKLQDRLGPTGNPVAVLDRQLPDWRETLPLEIHDSAAESLLTNLIGEANRLWRHRPPRLRIRRRLLVGYEDGKARLDALLDIPSYWQESQLRACLDRPADELPHRFDILLRNPQGSRLTVAHGTSVLEAGERRWRLEPWLTKEGCRYVGLDAAGAFTFWIREGDFNHGPFPLAKALDTDEGIPWTFAEESDGILVKVGEGRQTRREATLWVLAGPTWKGRARAGTCEAGGSVEGLPGARLWRMSGTVEWTNSDDAVLSISSQWKTDGSAEYRWLGSSTELGGKQLFLGLPRIVAYDAHENPVSTAPTIQWRPVGQHGAKWREDLEACLGDVWLRVLEENAPVNQERMSIVPEDFQVDLISDRDGGGGEIFIQGLAGARIGILENSAELKVEILPDEKAALLAVTSTGTAPQDLQLSCRWSDRRILDLRVPYPQRGAIFLDKTGSVMPFDSLVALDRLSGYRARATTLNPIETFYLTARGGSAADQFGGDWSVELPRIGRGCFELDLGVLQEKLARLPAFDRGLDAEIVLRIESSFEILRPHAIRVARFDGRLKMDPLSGTAGLPRTGWAECRIEVLPLWQPDQPFERLDEIAPGTFRFAPARRHSGPWLLVGREGNWCRFRPTVWHVGPEGESVPERLLTDMQKAARRPDPVERHSDFRRHLGKLVEDPDHQDWPWLEACLQRQTTLPNGTFEAASLVVELPELIAAAFWRQGNPNDRIEIWRTLEKLGFSWFCLPWAAWEKSMVSLRDCRRRSLGHLPADLADADTLFVVEPLSQAIDTLVQLRPCLSPLATRLRSELKTGPSPLEEPASLSVSQGLERVLESERQHLFHRVKGTRWPQPDKSLDEPAHLPHGHWLGRQLKAIGQVSGFKRYVLSAPLIAAHHAVHGATEGVDLSPALRRARDFDPSFFDKVYELALRLAASSTKTERTVA